MEACGCDELRRQVADFMLAFDSNMAPIVGQQVTLRKDSAGGVGALIDLMIAPAEPAECELVVKGNVDGEEVGFLYVGGGDFAPNRASAAHVSDAAVRSIAASLFLFLTGSLLLVLTRRRRDIA